MTVEQGKLGQILFYAVFLGLFFGFLYDLFRIRRRWFTLLEVGSSNKKWKVYFENVIIFFEDVLYSVVCAVIVCVFIYYTNSGRMRSMSFVGAGVGFLVYHWTLGRLVMFISGYCIAFFRMMFKKIAEYVLRPVFRFVMWLIYVTVGKCIIRLISRILDHRLIWGSKKGFGILKKREIKNGEEADKYIREGGNLRIHSVLHGNDHKDAV
ncbi:MAG: spore cortex biosynthesis protein YabQ [Clostridia bacterium]|nr:hypothetical protein [Oscillospiraceae bacterium]MBQ6702265.1 spore cortex biosynthesis protein YabQ [Clostridia bacterium]